MMEILRLLETCGLLKKEVALHLYIPSYYNIIKNHFKNWYYFDPFCGSGLFEFTKPSILKGEKFPGSPIITLAIMWTPDFLFEDDLN